MGVEAPIISSGAICWKLPTSGVNAEEGEMIYTRNSELATRIINNKRRRLDIPKLCFRFIGLLEYEALELGNC